MILGIGYIVLRNVRDIGLHREKLSGDQQTAYDFQRDFKAIVLSEDLSYEEIYNVDDFGLFWSDRSQK